MFTDFKNAKNLFPIMKMPLIKINNVNLSLGKSKLGTKLGLPDKFALDKSSTYIISHKSKNASKQKNSMCYNILIEVASQAPWFYFTNLWM